jgi:hypothetical protein
MHEFFKFPGDDSNDTQVIVIDSQDGSLSSRQVSSINPQSLSQALMSFQRPLIHGRRTNSEDGPRMLTQSSNLLSRKLLTGQIAYADKSDGEIRKSLESRNFPDLTPLSSGWRVVVDECS